MTRRDAWRGQGASLFEKWGRELREAQKTLQDILDAARPVSNMTQVGAAKLYACSFCGTGSDAVELIAGPWALVCYPCVALMWDIVQADKDVAAITPHIQKERNNMAAKKSATKKATKRAKVTTKSAGKSAPKVGRKTAKK